MQYSIIVYDSEHGCRTALAADDLDIIVEAFRELARMLPTTCFCLEHLAPGDCFPHVMECRRAEECSPKKEEEHED